MKKMKVTGGGLQLPVGIFTTTSRNTNDPQCFSRSRWDLCRLRPSVSTGAPFRNDRVVDATLVPLRHPHRHYRLTRFVPRHGDNPTKGT